MYDLRSVHVAEGQADVYKQQELLLKGWKTQKENSNLLRLNIILKKKIVQNLRHQSTAAKTLKMLLRAVRLQLSLWSRK